MNMRRLLNLLLITAALTGCTHFTAYRSTADLDMNALADMKTVSVGEDQHLDRSASIQHRRYVTDLEPDSQGDYYLSFVEFDDQGWFADSGRTQMGALLEQLEDSGKETLIYAYAHGWMHNASPGDNNVVYFSRLLERTDAAQKLLGISDRAVVGVN